MTGRRIAVVGLGGMGTGMAHRLLDAGFAVTVHNRTAARTAPLAAAGAQVAATAGEATAGAAAVLLSLSDESAVEQVAFGAVLPALPAGAVLIDTSTVSPQYAVAAAGRMAGQGVGRVEACVLGNPHQARAGQLRLLTAGDERALASVEDVLAALGRVQPLGRPGLPSVAKLVFNVLLGAQVASLAEAASLGERAGLDIGPLLDMIAESGFSSRVMAFRAGLMRERRWSPAAFRSALMAKDLRLALAEAERVGAAMPVVAEVARRFEEVVAAGDGDKDAAVILADQERLTAATVPR